MIIPKIGQIVEYSLIDGVSQPPDKGVVTAYLKRKSPVQSIINIPTSLFNISNLIQEPRQIFVYCNIDDATHLELSGNSNAVIDVKDAVIVGDSEFSMELLNELKDEASLLASKQEELCL